MSNKIDRDENDGEPIDRERRGLLVRFGLAAAAAPVLMTLSRAAYARGDDGGDDGGGDGGHDGGAGNGDRGGQDNDGHGYGSDADGRADRGDDDRYGHDGGDDSRDLDFDLRKTGANDDDIVLDLGADRAHKTE